MTLTIKQRVENGIDWLNKFGPEDWPDRVQLLDFDMSQSCKCVLGNVFRGESKACGIPMIGDGFDFGYECVMDEDSKTLLNCGFDASDESYHENTTLIEFNLLKCEWTDRIIELKAERRSKMIEHAVCEHFSVSPAEVREAISV